MALEFQEIDPVTGIPGSFVPYKCGNEHSLTIEVPPQLMVRSFYSWAQSGVVEILGGQATRPLVFEAWIHDSTFTSIAEIYTYLNTLDLAAGQFGNLKLTAIDASVIEWEDVRFVGFQRMPFDGQRRPEPVPAIGVSQAGYGDWHICGQLHFSQLQVT